MARSDLGNDELTETDGANLACVSVKFIEPTIYTRGLKRE